MDSPKPLATEQAASQTMTLERKNEVELIQKYAATLEGLEPIPLKQFLHQSQDIPLNKCLVQHCGDKTKNFKCKTEHELTQEIMHCLSQPDFLGKWGMDRTQANVKHCQMRCEIREGIKPTSKLYYLFNETFQQDMIDNFMNPYKPYQFKFKNVNECVLQDRHIFDYFQQINKNEQVFDRSKFDQMIRNTLHECFVQTYKNDFSRADMKVLNCAYYCQQFDPQIKNKVRQYGNQIEKGWYKTYEPKIKFEDLE